MKTFRVSWLEQGSAEGVWRLKISGVARDEFRTKNDAVSMAKRMAKQDAKQGEDTKLIVEKKSGARQNTYTYDAKKSNGGGIGLF